MAIIKKNIFTLFYLILILSSIILGLFLYKMSQDSLSDYIKEQRNLTKITANTINAMFSQYEMTLDIVSSQLLQDDNYKDAKKSQEILDSILKLDSTLVGFAIARADGNIYLRSSNLGNIKNLENLLQKIETKDSFLYTLKQNKMVIGRTYSHDKIKSLIIPIRKALRDKSGNLLGVVTSGVNVDKIFTLLSDSNYRTIVFRNFDYYNQISFQKHFGEEKFFEKKIPKSFIDIIIKDAETQYSTTIDKIKEKESLVTVRQKRLDNKKAILSAKYLNRFELWVTTQTLLDNINKVFYKKALGFISLYIFMMFVIYILFRSIDKYEKQKQKALKYEASHDYLTKLHNRKFLSDFEKLKKVDPFSLLFIDLDNFKNINDNYGHASGDSILKEVSNRLLSYKDKKDKLIRYSGDEFVLIVFNTDKEEIKKLAQKIINRLAEPYAIEQYEFKIGASIGISQYPLDANSFDKAKRYADIAMYEAKKEKNSFCLFEDTIKHKYLRKSVIEHELKSAISNDEIFMMYQPQVDNNGKLYGVEALVRWQNEKLGFVPPDEFIKVAEDSKNISSLGKHIIRTSISEVLDIQSRTSKKFQLSINISVKQFMEVDFYTNLLTYLEKVNFDNFHLTLEVTENVFIEDLNYILGIMEKLKKNQIKLSLDDFGTGYSSLSLLRKLPIDELKIDKSFIDDITHDKNSLSMARSIISIGKKFNMVVLAEGIETLEQKQLLEEYSCDLYQGYYYSRPLKKNDLIEYIIKNS